MKSLPTPSLLSPFALTLFFSIITEPTKCSKTVCIPSPPENLSQFLQTTAGLCFLRAHVSLIICAVHLEINHEPSCHLLNDCNKRSLNHSLQAPSGRRLHLGSPGHLSHCLVYWSVLTNVWMLGKNMTILNRIFPCFQLQASKTLGQCRGAEMPQD